VVCVTITREQVRDLQPGDVVEVRFASGSLMRGPLTADGYGGDPLLGIADVHWPLRLRDGDVQHYLKACDLAVVSRAPRPLYVNSDRTEPVPGDVVRIEHDGYPDPEPGDATVNVYLPTKARPADSWLSIHNNDIGLRYSTDMVIPGRGNNARGRAVLLVDGETGQVVQ
jgi:hypothetical protein